MALILRYFTKFVSFVANYVTVVEDRPIRSVKYHLPVTFSQN